MLAVGHAGQAAHRLALAARGQHDDLVVVVAVQIARLDEHLPRDLDLADVHRQLRDVHHAAPHEADPPAKFDAQVDHLLDAVQVGGEHRDDDALVGVLEQAAERLGDLLFAHRVAGTLDVGGIRQQREHALIAPCGQRAQVRHLTVDGGVVDLKVAGDDHRAGRAGNRHGHRAGDGMAYLDKLNRERADLHRIPRLYHVQLDAGNIMLRQLAAYERAGQLRAIGRRGYAREHIRHRADVILVSVGKQIRAHALAVVDQVGNVGNHQVDAQHILPGKDGAAVDHDDVVPVLKRRHVLADLADAAQRDNSQLCQVLHPPPMLYLQTIHMFQKPSARRARCSEETQAPKGS